MSGSHHAPEPARDSRYDLRTADQCEADALAQLALRVDNLVDALEVAARRIDRLEALVAAQRAAIERHADALTVINLRGAP